MTPGFSRGPVIAVAGVLVVAAAGLVGVSARWALRPHASTSAEIARPIEPVPAMMTPLPLPPVSEGSVLGSRRELGPCPWWSPGR